MLRMKKTYDVADEWTKADHALLEEYRQAEKSLPLDAPRALLSVRLSVLNDDTTSPVRQELDLRGLAREKGYRVVGVASDLNVSATKVPPWKRKSLGDWLSNRAPEFDALLFWKMDRFIRNMGDLAEMVKWVRRYDKNLVSKHDPMIDLSTPQGELMVMFVGAVAQIEAANTSTRVTSLWEYNKTQDEWLVGKPPYGYKGERVNGKNTLTLHEEQCKVLRMARGMSLDGASAKSIVETLKEQGLITPGSTTATMLRRLRNPGLMGLRVEEDKKGGVRRSKIVYGRDGQSIRVGPEVFSKEEFDSLQAVLDGRGKDQPTRNPAGATQFLGVLKCSDCDTNMTAKQYQRNSHWYAYLYCRKCEGGGLGAPNPKVVYDRLTEEVLAVLGDFPVQTREYAKGEEVRKVVADLEERIAHYMEGVAPGGRYTKTRFTLEQAEGTMDGLIAELAAIDPETTEDRWVYLAGGKTYREHWEEGGIDAIAADLIRAGITCLVTRTKVPRQRAPEVHLKLRIPQDVRQRLVVRPDEFGAKF